MGLKVEDTEIAVFGLILLPTGGKDAAVKPVI